MVLIFENLPLHGLSEAPI